MYILVKHRFVEGSGEQSTRIYPSPNGKYLALSTPSEIVFLEVSTLKRIGSWLFTPISTRSEYWFSLDLLWSLDSAGIMTVMPPSDPYIEVNEPSLIWYWPVSGNPELQHADLEMVPDISPDGTIWISPDLHWIAFHRSSNELGTDLELWVATTDGVEERLVYDGRVNQFGWFFDSSEFWFSVGVELFHGNLSGDAEPFLEEYSPASWPTPIDSTLFYFVSGAIDDEAWRLFVGDLSGRVTPILGSFPNLQYLDVKIYNP